MLEIAVRKSFGSFTLELEAGTDARVLGIVGPSGAGKSTLLNMIAGTVSPDRGRIVLNGNVLIDMQAGSHATAVSARGVGYVFQDGLLFPHMTVQANLLYGAGGHGDPPDFTEVVDALELGLLLKRRAAQLSGGESRRVAIGRALMSSPRILLLDEPLSGLDPRLSRSVLMYLDRILKRFEIPAVYASHSFSDILFLCGEAWFLRSGRLAGQGPPRRVLFNPSAGGDLANMPIDNLFVADVQDRSHDDFTWYRIGSQQVAAARLLDDSRSSALLSIRANEIILARKRPEQISARNVLGGRITEVSHSGKQALVTVDVGAEWIVQLTRGAISELDIQVGTEVFVIAKATSFAVSSLSIV